MPVVVKHSKVSGIADDPASAAAGEVLPSDWNADHTIDGLGSAAGYEAEVFARQIDFAPVQAIAKLCLMGA